MTKMKKPIIKAKSEVVYSLVNDFSKLSVDDRIENIYKMLLNTAPKAVLIDMYNTKIFDHSIDDID